MPPASSEGDQCTGWPALTPQVQLYRASAEAGGEQLVRAIVVCRPGENTAKMRPFSPFVLDSGSECDDGFGWYRALIHTVRASGTVMRNVGTAASYRRAARPNISPAALQVLRGIVAGEVVQA